MRICLSPTLGTKETGSARNEGAQFSLNVLASDACMSCKQSNTKRECGKCVKLVLKPMLSIRVDIWLHENVTLPSSPRKMAENVLHQVITRPQKTRHHVRTEGSAECGACALIKRTTFFSATEKKQYHFRWLHH